LGRGGVPVRTLRGKKKHWVVRERGNKLKPRKLSLTTIQRTYIKKNLDKSDRARERSRLSRYEDHTCRG